jgi:magnesium transporter
VVRWLIWLNRVYPVDLYQSFVSGQEFQDRCSARHRVGRWLRGRILAVAEPALKKDKAQTAGHLAIRRIPMASLSDTAGVVHGRLQSQRDDIIDLIIITDLHGRYRGVVELKRLLHARDTESIASLMREDWPTVLPDTDQERAADAATRSGVATLPVVTLDRQPVGVLSASILLEVLAQEHREDVHRFAGILHAQAGSIHALEDPPFRRTVRRLPWLLIGLTLSAAATGIMVGFERLLEADVTVAFFIPALVYLADAVGTQTEMIAVRHLSLRRRPLGSLLRGEILTGGLIGLALGLIAYLAVWATFGSTSVAAGVGISLLAACMLASALGLLLPWMLARLGIDPAFGSGPVATIIQDVATILIYFAVMTALLQT